jgi:hypothetical protein
MVEQNAKVIRQMMPTVPLARFGLTQVTPQPFASLTYGQVPVLEATQRRLASSLRRFASLKPFWTSLIERRRAVGAACSAFLQRFTIRGPKSFNDGLAAVQAAREHYTRLFANRVALAIRIQIQRRSSRQRAPGHDVATQPRVVRGPTSREVSQLTNLAGPRIVHSAA